MVPCAKPIGWLFVVLLLVMAACTGGEPEVAATPTADTAIIGPVSAVFATYRAGVIQGDGQAVRSAIDQDSAELMQAIAEDARIADEETVRALPAAQQLLVLTYRLVPDLLDSDDPYVALVDAGLAGQDRSLGELGQVTPIGEDEALGQIVDAQSGRPTPLRWHFVREDNEWKFDLANATDLLSQAIATAATRAGTSVDEVVTGTVADLSGEDPETIGALYSQGP